MKTALTQPTNVYVALHTADPGADGQSGNEVSGGSYARVSTSGSDWNAGTTADPSVTSNANTITFPQATASWGTVTHFSLWTSSSGTTAAEFIGASSLTSSQAIANTNTASFAAGALTHSLDSV